MHVPACPKDSQAGEQTEEGLEIARFLKESAYTKGVGFVYLLLGHRSRIHYHGGVLVNAVLLQSPKHCQPIENRHAIIEDDDTRFTLGPVVKPPLSFETIEDLLAVLGYNQFIFELRRVEGASYKEDVILVVFPEQYPAAMWHIVKVYARWCALALRNVVGGG